MLQGSVGHVVFIVISDIQEFVSFGQILVSMKSSNEGNCPANFAIVQVMDDT